MLQRRFRRAGIPAKRFIVNSTVGLLGLFDVAAHAGVMHHNNEFGVTLGTAMAQRPAPICMCRWWDPQLFAICLAAASIF